MKGRLQNIQFDVVFSSPLQRAKRTAELAGFPTPQLTPLLREVDYGEYEGMTTKAIRASRPGWELYKDGSPGGDTPSQIYARAMEFINLASGAGGRVLAFSHGHFLRVLAARWIGSSPTKGRHLLLNPASVSLLSFEHSNPEEPVIALWNGRL